MVDAKKLKELIRKAELLRREGKLKYKVEMSEMGLSKEELLDLQTIIPLAVSQWVNSLYIPVDRV